jgi:MFS transporter, OPA family, glycerol-3-phosphate transporter
MLEPAASERRLRCWQLRVFGLLWGAYASYYLCRVNFAVAQPAILREFPSWTSAQIGMIPSTFALAYAVGLLVNGTLGQRYGARRMMTAGLLIASLSNLLLAFTRSLGAMQALWALNGWGQSAGWALMVHTLSDWNTSARRGTLISRLSTSYQVGHVVSWLLAGVLCDTIGWRVAFVVPGLLVLPMALMFFLYLRDSPVEAGFRPVRDDVAPPSNPPPATAPLPAGSSLWPVLRLTLSSPVLWILAIGCFMMNAVRYSYINWSVQYMADFHGRSLEGSVLTAIVLPLAGSAGALSAGWVSDVFFGRRRAPVCVIMMLGLAATCAGMVFVPQGGWLAATALLGVAGFMMYGSDVLMAGAATVDLSHPKAGSIATGFTMCLGGLGAILSGAGVGYLKDLSQGSWSPVFWVLAALPLMPAALMLFLWNARPENPIPGIESINPDL